VQAPFEHDQIDALIHFIHTKTWRSPLLQRVSTTQLKKEAFYSARRPLSHTTTSYAPRRPHFQNFAQSRRARTFPHIPLPTMAEEKDLQLLEQALSKFGFASDAQFPSLTETLLPPLIEKLSSPSPQVRSKVRV